MKSGLEVIISVVDPWRVDVDMFLESVRFTPSEFAAQEIKMATAEIVIRRLFISSNNLVQVSNFFKLARPASSEGHCCNISGGGECCII